MRSEMSATQVARSTYEPSIVPVLENPATLEVLAGEPTTAMNACDQGPLTSLFPSSYGYPLLDISKGKGAEAKPLRIGFLFCGRQAPGGHNVISGLYDYVKAVHPESTVFGFVGGTIGFFEKNYIEVTEDVLSLYRNQGGYDMLGRTVDAIYTAEHMAAGKQTCIDLSLDGLVLVGSHGTASHAGYLTEYFLQEGVSTRVVVAPGSIDGDMKSQFVEASFGFDTACKVYSELIGNISTDGCSARKYYYFIRLMGRGASHIALECALQTHPDVVLLGEEVRAGKLSLPQIVGQLADVCCARAEGGKNFGVVLLPEGLIACIPEMASLIKEIDALFTKGEGKQMTVQGVLQGLTPWSAALYSFLPPFIQQQLVLERQSNGALQLTQVETERLLSHLTAQELQLRKEQGRYKGSFNSITHFFGYQARCSTPSNFDCTYATNLGRTCGVLVHAGHTGYMASVRNLKQPVSEWSAGGVPLTALMTTDTSISLPSSSVEAAEVKQGDAASTAAQAASGLTMRAYVPAAVVDLSGQAYVALRGAARQWVLSDTYRNPGPIQFQGPCSDDTTITLQLEEHDYLGKITELRQHLDAARQLCRPGCPLPLLNVALEGMSSLTNILNIMRQQDGNCL